MKRLLLDAIGGVGMLAGLACFVYVSGAVAQGRYHQLPAGLVVLAGCMVLFMVPVWGRGKGRV